MSPAPVIPSHDILPSFKRSHAWRIAMAGVVAAAAVVFFVVPLIIAMRLELRSRKNFVAADRLSFIRASRGEPQRQAA